MIRQRDGIHIQTDQQIIADARSTAGEINIISHAHSDHLTSGVDRALCSDTTASLIEARTDTSIQQAHHDRIDLLPSGHIIGSRAALIQDTEETVLYTGDVSTRDRAYLQGFQPPEADTLIIESTYGLPAYRFPDQQALEQEIRDWVQDQDRPLLLFGYSLGKAQKIQHIIQDATNRPIIAHGSIINMNRAVQETTDLSFSAAPYQDNKDLLQDDGILIAPSHSSRADWVETLTAKHGAVKAGFSGWAVNDSYQYRGDYDRAFPLSDHCDFSDLVELVRQVDPDQVYTHHGFDEAFA
ncbi:MAG: mRNA cleavage and polyadenylation specificity factor-like protein, partial [Candidatus Nanohaloarchaea archaeon]|nr:mRNA cleavage and polyadenylation specificity factor-like protein [Candidatus Nanohaloarchaea archaeon]